MFRALTKVNVLIRQSRSLLILFLGLSLSALFPLGIANAEPNPNKKTGLFLSSSQSAKTSYSSNRKAFGVSREQRKLSSSELRLDSAEEILGNEGSQNRFFAHYKGLIYLKYFNDDLEELAEFDDLDSPSLAKTMLMYQGARALTEWIKTTPLADSFRRTLRELKSYREYTTLNVRQGHSGELDLNNGDLDSPPIVKFRIGMSTRNGIYPRLYFFDLFHLQHDILHNTTSIEYTIDF